MRDNLVDDADAQGLFGVDVVTSKAVSQGVLIAGGQHPKEAGIGDVAHLRLAEDCLIRGERHVGCGGVPGRAAHAPPVDCTNDGLGQLPHVEQFADTVVVVRAP